MRVRQGQFLGMAKTACDLSWTLVGILPPLQAKRFA